MPRPDLTKTLGHAAPDWFAQRATTQIFYGFDVAELAARLGSPARFYRAGNVLFWDDFGTGLTKGEQLAAAGGTLPVLTTVRTHGNGYAAILDSNPTDESRSYMEYRLMLPELSKMGFEACFQLDDGSMKFEIRVDLRDGTTQHLARLRYKANVDTIQYWDSTGAWVAAATNVKHLVQDYRFHYLKLIIDPSAKKYVRALFNDRKIDLSTIAYQTPASTAATRVSVEVGVITLDGATSYGYLDHFIFTINEP